MTWSISIKFIKNICRVKNKLTVPLRWTENTKHWAAYSDYVNSLFSIICSLHHLWSEHKIETSYGTEYERGNFHHRDVISIAGGSHIHMTSSSRNQKNWLFYNLKEEILFQHNFQQSIILSHQEPKLPIVSMGWLEYWK